MVYKRITDMTCGCFAVKLPVKINGKHLDSYAKSE